MGNWRGIEMIGTCPADEVEALREHCLAPGRLLDEYFAREDREKITPEEWDAVPDEWALCYTENSSLFGFENWPAEKIHSAGNVGKDVSIEDLVHALVQCAAVAPGLAVRVHVGEEWEQDGVVATLVLEDGSVTELPPEVESIGGVSDVEAGARMARMMT